MKAIRVYEFGPPEVMRYEETAAPRPGSGQVVVRVKAAGVNPVEAYIRSGMYAARKPDLPYTPGGDAAGTVEEVGGDVPCFKPGDRVYTSGSLSGTYAELALCLKTQVHPLPENVSYEQGAALGVPYGTAWRALFQKAKVKPGETVLIHGASGGVGIAAVQLAVAAGVTVIATAGSERGLTLLSEQGADHVLDHRAEGYLDRVKTLTQGNGADVVLEMRAELNLARDLETIARHGRVVIIGSRGVVSIDPREIMAKESEVQGMVLFAATPDDLKSIHAALQAGLSLGTLTPVIGRQIRMREAHLAHKAIMEERAYGKIVLVS
jgi:NADPH:quinone reductase